MPCFEQQLENSGDKVVKEYKPTGDDVLNIASACCQDACVADIHLDDATWVKAAEFVPGQIWQSVCKSDYFSGMFLVVFARKYCLYE